jgi:hypothetical protein
MTGAELLCAYLAKTGKTRLQAAYELKASTSQIHYWCSGVSIPRLSRRPRIRRWSKGFIPEASWEEQAARKAG